MFKANITNIPNITIIPCPSDLEITKIYITSLPCIAYILSAFAFEIKVSKANITNIPNITIIP